MGLSALPFYVSNLVSHFFFRGQVFQYFLAAAADVLHMLVNFLIPHSDIILTLGSSVGHQMRGGNHAADDV
jgi:hypothetical protein